MYAQFVPFFIHVSLTYYISKTEVKIMEYVTLNNGIKMPKLGYGVYQTPPEDTKRCVLDAIEIGYRSIDTAQAYFNEEGVGAALAECGLPREEFFLTTKV